MSGDGFFGSLADEILRESAFDQVPDVIVSEPVTMASLRELMPAALPLRTLHCHPSVTGALRLAAPPKPEPDFMALGQIGNLCGKVVTFGVLRSEA